MTPIIVPITNTREVNCIIQEGVRYCEKEDIKQGENNFSIDFLLITILSIWIIFGIGLVSTQEEVYQSNPLVTPASILIGVITPLLLIVLFTVIL